MVNLEWPDAGIRIADIAFWRIQWRGTFRTDRVAQQVAVGQTVVPAILGLQVPLVINVPLIFR